jgi:hypothetical protein
MLSDALNPHPQHYRYILPNFLSTSTFNNTYTLGRLRCKWRWQSERCWGYQDIAYHGRGEIPATKQQLVSTRKQKYLCITSLITVKIQIHVQILFTPYTFYCTETEFSCHGVQIPTNVRPLHPSEYLSTFFLWCNILVWAISASHSHLHH